MYKLYTDKNKTFTCNVDIEGASLNESEARIILETKNLNVLFNGKIKRDGTCEIEIDKIKFLPEDTRGTIKLEIIAENTLFTPWESEFVVETQKKVKISEVNERGISENKKNDIKVLVEVENHDDFKNQKENNLTKHMNVLKKLMEKHDFKLNSSINIDDILESYKNVLKRKNVFLKENEIIQLKNNLKKII